MPKMTKCALCGEKGGRFRFREGQGDWVHVGRCTPADKPMNGTHANWPIVTSNAGGDPNLGPMVIQNLAHLRRVEREHGVSSDCYNYDRSNRAE